MTKVTAVSSAELIGLERRCVKPQFAIPAAFRQQGQSGESRAAASGRRSREERSREAFPGRPEPCGSAGLRAAERREGWAGQGRAGPALHGPRCRCPLAAAGPAAALSQHWGRDSASHTSPQEKRGREKKKKEPKFYSVVQKRRYGVGFIAKLSPAEDLAQLVQTN